ncbi:MAG: hypothetical protein ACKO15_14330, partial [Burkholderiales bacterium]
VRRTFNIHSAQWLSIAKTLRKHRSQHGEFANQSNVGKVRRALQTTNGAFPRTLPQQELNAKPTYPVGFFFR